MSAAVVSVDAGSGGVVETNMPPRAVVRGMEGS